MEEIEPAVPAEYEFEFRDFSEPEEIFLITGLSVFCFASPVCLREQNQVFSKDYSFTS